MSLLARIDQRMSDALINAHRWLCELELSEAGPLPQLLRLFAVIAIDGRRSPERDAAVQQFSTTIPQFDLNDSLIDPVLALTTYRALRVRGIAHPSLSKLAKAYANVLSNNFAGKSDDELALIGYLCRLSELDVPKPSEEDAQPIQSQDGLIAGTRTEILEICRLILMRSACGVRRIDVGKLSIFLPGLSLSYAIEWDIDAVTALLRTCIYIGVEKEPSCCWALEWLLDQQDRDGKFGLLTPEVMKLNYNPGDWQAYLGPTVAAVWCLTEMRQPGFLVSST